VRSNYEVEFCFSSSCLSRRVAGISLCDMDEAAERIAADIPAEDLDTFSFFTVASVLTIRDWASSWFFSINLADGLWCCD